MATVWSQWAAGGMARPAPKRNCAPVWDAPARSETFASGTARAYAQIDSFSSLAARKATFFDALILIASPVAGLRPMRAGRLRT